MQMFLRLAPFARTDSLQLIDYKEEGKCSRVQTKAISERYILQKKLNKPIRLQPYSGVRSLRRLSRLRAFVLSNVVEHTDSVLARVASRKQRLLLERGPK